MFGDCKSVCKVDVHWCKCHRRECSGTRLLSPGLAQQHRRTRQAVYPKHRSSAQVFGECTPVCRLDVHRCKCSDTNLLSAGLAQQHTRTWQAVYPKQCCCALVFVTAHLYAEWIFIGKNGVAQGCCQLVWHSSTEEQGRLFTLNTAAVQRCLVTANLYAKWMFIGVNAVAQTCCQLVWHSSIEEQGRLFTLNTAAVHWCLVTANLYAEWMFIGVSVLGVNAVVQGCCQLVWYSSIEEQGRDFTLNTAAVHWCLVTANLYAEWMFIGVSVLGVNAVVQGCCQLVWYSSIEEQGRQFTLNTAAVHWCLVTANMYAEWMFIGVNAVAQGCCQLIWHSNTEEQGRQSTLNTAAVHWYLVTAHLYAEWIFKGVNAVAQPVTLEGACCVASWPCARIDENWS